MFNIPQETKAEDTIWSLVSFYPSLGENRSINQQPYSHIQPSKESAAIQEELEGKTEFCCTVAVL